MKISKIYCNLPVAFGPIKFNLGSIGDPRLNIIIATITKPKDQDRDSHNLGKTSLIHIIDFLLLKGVSEENSFLIKHRDQFENFVFFGEFLSDTGSFVSVRRSVSQPSKASFKIHNEPDQDLIALEARDWDHSDVGEKKARQILDSYFELTDVSPWDYRKGVGYFLRSQQDYNDYFQIAKFVKGSDSDWKPYLAKVLGFPYETIEKKYEIDQAIVSEKSLLSEAESSATLSLEDIGKLRIKIANKQTEVDLAQSRLDSFSFSDEEMKLTANLTGAIESEISTINGVLYNLEIDLSRATASINKSTNVNFEKVKKLYEEANVYLPEKLIHDHIELQDFVKKITSDRNRQLKKQITALEIQISTLQKRRVVLDQQRQTALSVIRDVDSLKKFKSLQKSLIEASAEIRVFQSQIEILEKAKSIRERIKALEEQQRDLQDEIEQFPDSGPVKYLAISAKFHSLVKTVLGIEGNFYIKANKSGNIEYRIDTEQVGSGSNVHVTSQSKGTTYRKLLCALFDLAVLSVYSTGRFFHFVYHDGILEGLDNRKKISYLKAIREVAEQTGIQYILTLIESDLPRNDSDKPMYFDESEIVLRLSDDDESGRLFRMASF